MPTRQRSVLWRQGERTREPGRASNRSSGVRPVAGIPTSGQPRCAATHRARKRRHGPLLGVLPRRAGRSCEVAVPAGDGSAARRGTRGPMTPKPAIGFAGVRSGRHRRRDGAVLGRTPDGETTSPAAQDRAVGAAQHNNVAEYNVAGPARHQIATRFYIVIPSGRCGRSTSGARTHHHPPATSRPNRKERMSPPFSASQWQVWEEESPNGSDVAY
jgi:hypothetical protein